MEYTLLYKNQLINNIYDACTCCYDNTKDLDYFQKKDYIAKRIDAGHESILEHGKLAMLFKGITNPNQIANIAGYEYSKWLEFYTVELEDGKYNMIINGSIRAYKHFLTHISEDTFDNDSISKYVASILLNNTPKELYGKHYEIEDFLESHKFVDVEPDVVDLNKSSRGIFYDNIFVKEIPSESTPLNKDNVKKEVIIGIDNFHTHQSQYLSTATIRMLEQAGFNLLKIIPNIIPVTIVFKNISRTATHQLVRHRNAITQESQRYVNACNASFTIPTEVDKRFNVTLFGNTTFSVTLKSLATELTNIYSQLLAQGLKKEEARAFLPSNINCGRLYMTFTLSSLDAFIELRTDPHAQKEIRLYATSIDEVIHKHKSNLAQHILEEQTNSI
jgi:flavin-dependent thymidylate synthase